MDTCCNFRTNLLLSPTDNKKAQKNSKKDDNILKVTNVISHNLCHMANSQSVSSVSVSQGSVSLVLSCLSLRLVLVSWLTGCSFLMDICSSH